MFVHLLMFVLHSLLTKFFCYHPPNYLFCSWHCQPHLSFLGYDAAIPSPLLLKSKNLLLSLNQMSEDVVIRNVRVELSYYLPLVCLF